MILKQDKRYLYKFNFAHIITEIIIQNVNLYENAIFDYLYIFGI